MRNPFRRWPREPQEQRAVTSVPWDIGPLRYDTAAVTETKALGLAPVYAAVRHLTDSISTLPLKPYRRAGERREPMANLPQLFQFLVEDGTLVDWLSQAVTSLSLHGNAIGLITSHDGFQFPTTVVWRPRQEWAVDDTSNPFRPQWYFMGRKIERSEIVHIPWLTIPGKTLGLSPLEYAALSMTGGLSAQKYGTEWFDAGGVPPGTFKNAAVELTAEQTASIKATLVSAIRTRQPIVYGRDWDYNAITVPPEQAQFVESQKLTANQIAAIYGIEPEEVGGEPANSLTYNNEEHRQTKRVANLRPWLVRLETGFSALLPERQYVKFNADAPIRSDLKTRHEVYKIDRDIGLLSIDEMRALEELPPLPDGQGADYTPLSTRPTVGELRAVSFPAIVPPDWTRPE